MRKLYVSEIIVGEQPKVILSDGSELVGVTEVDANFGVQELSQFTLSGFVHKKSPQSFSA